MEKLLPKFCERCGEKVFWSKPDFAWWYDEQTGKKQFRQQLICPNVRWYTLGHHHPYKAYYESGPEYYLHFGPIEEKF